MRKRKKATAHKIHASGKLVKQPLAGKARAKALLFFAWLYDMCTKYGKSCGI